MNEHLPVYGPTQILPDEGIEPDVIVRVAYALSREQLAIALGIGWAQMADGRDPGSLSVAEVREEVEGILGAAGVVEIDEVMDRDRRRTYPPEQQAVMDLLAAAVDRAYPAASTFVERPVQQPRYGNGTVTLQTLDHGEVTIPEPEWCTGHEGEVIGPLAEVSHDGAHITATVDATDLGPVSFMRANLTHAPYLEIQPEPHPLAYVEALEAASFDADGLRQLVATGRAYLDRLEALASQLDALTEGGQG